MPVHLHGPAQGATGGRLMMSMDLGGGGRFARLKKKLSGRGGVRDPGALAAAIGRKKYGKKRFQKLAAGGKKRRGGKGKKANAFIAAVQGK